MNTKEIMDYCLEKKGAWVDFPFGDGSMLIKVTSHYFASLFNLRGIEYLTLRCERNLAALLRETYPDTIKRGYHCPLNQQPTNNTIEINNEIPVNELKNMIDHSYEYVVGKLKKTEKEILNRE